MSERIPAGGPYKAAIGMHEPLSLEHLMEAKRMLSVYCGAGEQYCCSLIRYLVEASLLVARSRLNDLIDNKKYNGIDKGLLVLYDRLIKFYALYISGLALTFGEDPIMIAKHRVEIDGVLVQPGEYIRLPVDKAAALYLAGIMEPAQTTFIKIGTTCIGEEEERQE